MSDENRKKKVLLLGAGLMQIPAMNAVKNAGHTLVVADANPNAVGKSRSDEFWNINIRDAKTLATTAAKKKIDAVFTCATDFSYTVAIVASACKIPGLSPEQALVLNDKRYMRDFCHKVGIPIPSYRTIEKEEKQVDAVNFDLPAVTKPVDNMGSRGVRCVFSREELGFAIRESRRFSPSSNVIIEQKLDGPELSIDAAVVDSVLVPLGIADRHVYFSPYRIETGHSIPSRLPRKMQDAACYVLQKLVTALEVKDAIVKGDIIFHKGIPYIGECAARLSGGYMSGWTIPYMRGDDPASIALDIALGIPLRESMTMRRFEKHNAKKMWVAERAIVSLSGEVAKIHRPKHLRSCTSDPPLPNAYDERCNSGVKNIIMTSHRGSILDFPTDNTQKAGSIIGVGHTALEANYHVAKALSEVCCHVIPNKKSDVFLYSDSETDFLRSMYWFCYPRTHSIMKKFLKRRRNSRAEEAVWIECHRRSSLAIYLPEPLQNSEEIGTWTHISLVQMLSYAREKKQIYYVTRWEDSMNAVALKAALRGGWRGIEYTICAFREARPWRFESFFA